MMPLLLATLIAVAFPRFTSFALKTIGGIAIIAVLTAMGWPAIIARLVVVAAIIVIRMRPSAKVFNSTISTTVEKFKKPADPLDVLLQKRRLAKQECGSVRGNRG